MPTSLPQILEKEPNRWYLAYGSNLSSKTFEGRRGIRPLARCNVTVPSLELTFDLPGIPYWEPCFANVRRRDVGSNTIFNSRPVLTGVAYLITPQDYRKVIASEGGGVSYEETAVECWRLPGNGEITSDLTVGEERAPVQGDLGERLIAYTLLAPDRKRRSALMQPSKRYISIIQSGAREHHFPPSYVAYLDSIPHYQTAGIKQKLGASLFLAICFPILLAVILLQKIFADNQTGRLPSWLGTVTEAALSTIWQNYERVWKKIFGSGEITEHPSVNEASKDIGKAGVTKEY